MLTTTGIFAVVGKDAGCGSIFCYQKGEQIVLKTYFEMGNIITSAGVAELMDDSQEFMLFVTHSIARHSAGDWGDLDAADKKANDEAVKSEKRILSAYNDDCFPKHGVETIWIITEGDRSVTTVLFPDEN